MMGHDGRLTFEHNAALNDSEIMNKPVMALMSAKLMSLPTSALMAWDGGGPATRCTRKVDGKSKQGPMSPEKVHKNLQQTKKKCGVQTYRSDPPKRS